MAGKLRIKNVFGQRAVASESRDTKPVYVVSVAGEGKTEEAYFGGVKEMIGDKNIILDRLERFDTTDTASHPNYILRLLDERVDKWEDYGFEANELWMVVDRDKQNVSAEQLKSILNTCEKKHYNLAISNPTFELWLLLHLTDLNKYSYDDLLNNIKVNKNRRFIEKELSDILHGYNKSNFNFIRFKPGITTAIERSNKLTTDNSRLIDELGTSVGILIEKLIK